ncbi:hypothetical protein Gogos_018916 [Gossypium gossypioides]|uniref:Reverse transcriptase zinc-binding domain-containing protein n=1 Tax=Gossypium gossypioides TaxID=34282 RepID=A0A7J9BFT3_GOSGO|nr:hypothetical protein [Gossypium gossypioides]
MPRARLRKRFRVRGVTFMPDKEAFWVRVLRSKYQMKDELPVCIDRDRSSFLWKSLSKIWALLRENLHWSVGDGHKIQCWKDNWIPDIGPLFRHTSPNANLNSDCLLHEMITEEGLWKANFGAQKK